MVQHKACDVSWQREQRTTPSGHALSFLTKSSAAGVGARFCEERRETAEVDGATGDAADDATAVFGARF